MGKDLLNPLASAKRTGVIFKWKLVLPVLALILGLVLFVPRNAARTLAERTRRELKAQGFKVDLDEFHLETSNRNSAFDALSRIGGGFRSILPNNDFDLLRPLTPTSALVLWKQDPLWSENSTDNWARIRIELERCGPDLDAARTEILSGPLRFGSTSSSGPGLSFPHLPGIRFAASALAAQTLLDLHDHRPGQSWTNLLALTRLVSQWQPEPVATACLIRFRCVSVAQRTLWQALQSQEWTDVELRTLQSEWGAPRFFAALPDAIAFARADLIASCAAVRSAPPPPGPTFRQLTSDLLTSLDRAWDHYTAGMRHSRYRSEGSYQDEVAIMICLRQREIDLRNAINSSSWLEMRAHPGITNPAKFVNDPQSELFPTVETRMMTFPSLRASIVLINRAAEAEARRRLALCALALKRYRLARGEYPPALDQLVPEFQEQSALDFMNGQPLHYQRLENDTFVLYSVGLNCLDDHAQMLMDTSLRGPNAPEDPDLVWPAAATRQEVRAAFEAQQKRWEAVSAAGYPVLSAEGRASIPATNRSYLLSPISRPTR